jgi:hypothetical protein
MGSVVAELQDTNHFIFARRAMKFFSRTVLGVVAAAAGIAACSGADAAAPASAETIAVSVVVPPGAQPNNGFYIPSDTVNVTAIVLDASGVPLIDATVDWQLQPAEQSVAVIRSTGAQSAQLVFARQGTVGIVASVTRGGGSKITTTKYLTWPQ